MFASTSSTVSQFIDFLLQPQYSSTARVLLVTAAALLSHLVIRLIGAATEWLVTASHRSRGRLWSVAQKPKFVTLLRLAANTATWVVYFLAIGLILEQAGINLTTYLASASIIGLTISFGSQNLVQDMVAGLTLLFSDAIDVDDTVEITGAVVVVGRVQEIGLRFTKVINLYNQVVLIPNRTIANVIKYIQGGIYAYADVSLPRGADPAQVTASIQPIVAGMQQQFSAIVLGADIAAVATSPDGAANYIRVRFKIWPGQGALIENTFCQRAVSAMLAFDPGYTLWRVPVSYRTPQHADED